MFIFDQFDLNDLIYKPIMLYFLFTFNLITPADISRNELSELIFGMCDSGALDKKMLDDYAHARYNHESVIKAKNKIQNKASEAKKAQIDKSEKVDEVSNAIKTQIMNVKHLNNIVLLTQRNIESEMAKLEKTVEELIAAKTAEKASKAECKKQKSVLKDFDQKEVPVYREFLSISKKLFEFVLGQKLEVNELEKLMDLFDFDGFLETDLK